MIAIGVIGSGAWGTTLALVLARKGLPVTLWEHRPERAAQMQQSRENTTFLPGFTLPDQIQVTSSIEEAVREKTLLLLVTPSQKMRANLRLLAPHLHPETLLVSASKGIELTTLKRMTEVIAEELPAWEHQIGALSGPNLSVEVANGKPAAAVVASANQDVAIRARDLLSTPWFRVYSADDVVGVELAGALKNVIAIAAGVNDGLGYGENAKATMITRGLAEISRLGIAAGAKPLTFAGLAGIGDLIATCATPLSRNQKVGQRLATGESLEQILASMSSVAEGVTTTRAVLELATRYQVDMPIAYQLSRVLFEQTPPAQAVAALMLRDLKAELDSI